MTLKTAVLDSLSAGPRSRPEIEEYLISVGYAPAGVTVTLMQLKRANRVRHVRRGGRYRQSLYALEDRDGR